MSKKNGICECCKENKEKLISDRRSKGDICPRCQKILRRFNYKVEDMIAIYDYLKYWEEKGK